MRALYLLGQWTWGIVQNLLGGGLALLLGRPHFRYRYAVVTRWRLGGSMSLGMFLFLGGKAPNVAHPEVLSEPERRVLVHEYGHTIQSLLLGPLYLPVIGLPSLVWANLPAWVRYRAKRHVSYYAFYPEAWANRLGRKATRLLAPEQKD